MIKILLFHTLREKFLSVPCDQVHEEAIDYIMQFECMHLARHSLLLIRDRPHSISIL